MRMRTRHFGPVAFVLVLSLSLLNGWHAARAAEPAAPAKPPAQAQAAPFEQEIRAFEAADAKAPLAKGGVLFVGSSSIRKWTTLAEDFPGVPVINRGFGGSKIADSTRYAGRIVTPYEPRTIVFYAGDNDLASGLSPEQVLADYQAFVARVREKLPDTRIYFISIKPSKARWKIVDRIKEANRLVKAFTESSDKLGFIDVFPLMLGADGKPRDELLVADGLHMTRKGYEIWRDAVTPYLKRE
jgi:lysophospholipase L1-like esterase